MAYPKQERDLEAQMEQGTVGAVVPPSLPTVPQTQNIQGGAPVVNWMPAYARTDFKVTRVPNTASPVPAVQWKPTDVQDAYGGLISDLAQRLWEKYQNPEIKTEGRFWQNVAVNPQEVARMAVTRMLARKAGVQAEQLPPGIESDRSYRFLEWLRSR